MQMLCQKIVSSQNSKCSHHTTLLIMHHHHHHHQSVLPKGRSFTASAEPRLQFYWRQDFQHKLRNQGCSFTRDWIGVVDSHCFPHPTLSLASERTLKYLKRSHGHHVEVRRMELANWALQTSLKFTTGVKYQFHQGFWPDQRSWNPNHPSSRNNTTVNIS